MKNKLTRVFLKVCFNRLALAYILFLHALDTPAQYVYMDDNSTSWVQAINKNDLLIAVNYRKDREKSIQLAYSPFQSISIKAGLFLHQLDQPSDNPDYAAYSEGSTFTTVVGYYKNFKPLSFDRGQIDSTAQSFIYTDFGFSKGNNRNNIGTLFRSNFDFNKYTMESGLGYRSKYGTFCLSLRYALIHFRSAKIVGSDEQFESYVFETRDKLSKKSTYSGWTINVQYGYQLHAFSILLGFPVFMPHVQKEKRVPIPVGSGPYIAFAVNLNAFKKTPK